MNNQIDKCITSRTNINKSQERDQKTLNDVNKQQNKTSFSDKINPGKENQDQTKIRNKILDLDKQITDRLKKLNKKTPILSDSQENNGFLESILEENSFCESAEKDLEEKQKISLLDNIEENNKRMSFAETKQNVEKILEEINKRNENKEHEQNLKKNQNDPPPFLKKKNDENKKLFFEDFNDFNEKELINSGKNQNFENPLTARLENNNNPEIISNFDKNIEISNFFDEKKDEISKNSQELRFFKHIHSFSASKSNFTDEINGRDILQSIKESAKKKQEKMMKELQNRRFCPEKEKIMDILKTHRAISNHENSKIVKSHHKNSYSFSETKVNNNVEITNFNENNDLKIEKFEEKPKNKEELIVKNLNEVIFEKIEKTPEKKPKNELFVDKILSKLLKNEKNINIIENSKNEIISVDQVLRTMKREPIKPTEPFKEFKLNSKIIEKEVNKDEKRFSLEVFSKENMKNEAEKDRKKGGSAYSTPKTIKSIKFLIF